MLTKRYILILLAGTFAGCASHAPATPGWLNDPGKGVVASCGFNIKGRHYQEECARTRAREQLAARHGVVINSESVLTERVNNERASVVMDKTTHQEVGAVEIRARELGSWYDPQRDLFYVWMEEH